MEKFPCKLCHEPTNKYMVHLQEVLLKEPDKDYICYKCIERYLDDNTLDAVMEYSIGAPGSKYEGNKYFEKAILISGSTYNLIPYSYRAARSWKHLHHTSRVWYNTAKQKDVDHIIGKFYNNAQPAAYISAAQVQLINILLNKIGTKTKQDIYKEYSVKSLKDLSKTQATKLIDYLKLLEGDN